MWEVWQSLSRTALVDFFSNNRQNEFTEGILAEKKKYAWSNMTRSVRKAAE